MDHLNSGFISNQYPPLISGFTNAVIQFNSLVLYPIWTNGFCVASQDVLIVICKISPIKPKTEPVILDHDENAMYTICVKAGILNGKYSRNQFDLCPHPLLKDTDVDNSKTVSLRHAVSVESSSGGQGYVKCNCAGSKRCQTKRCKCYKNKVKCSSRCHSSLLCINK